MARDSAPALAALHCDNFALGAEGDRNTVSQCNLHDSSIGVLMAGDSNRLGPGNAIHRNSIRGVHLSKVSNATVDWNRVFDNAP